MNIYFCLFPGASRYQPELEAGWLISGRKASAQPLPLLAHVCHRGAQQRLYLQNQNVAIILVTVIKWIVWSGAL